MSTIVDVRAGFGERLRAERRARGWTMDRLAAASGVSRAMISRIERGESSPTAVVLGKLSSALELSMPELLTPGAVGVPRVRAFAGGDPGPEDPGGAVRRAAETPEWRDPDSGYLRRAVSTPRFPAAVTEIILPPGARVPYPAGAYAFIAQLVWVLSGQLTLADGPAVHVLAGGDTFELGEPRPREFRNDGAGDCRYVVVVIRTAAPLRVPPRPHAGPARAPCFPSGARSRPRKAGRAGSGHDCPAARREG